MKAFEIARMIGLMAAFLAVIASSASAQSPNQGDPLFCQPQEGTTFLIVNGGAGIFTVDADCFNNNTANDTTLSITTNQGGTLTGVRASANINYTYTPPTPTFTGTDTFTFHVTTVWNGAGGTGSAGGTARPGGPANLNITLNVLPSTTMLQVAGAAKLVPIPAGSVTGCGAQGNAGLGPPASAVPGCTTAVGLGAFRSPASATTTHGSVSNSGTTLLRYTPTAGYTGPDTFTYQVFGTNTDGTYNLNSGNVTMQVTVNAPLVITNTSPLPSVMFGTPYPAQTFAATGGFPDYTFSLASGALPPGLSFSGGVLSGTPTTPGIYNFNIQVTDSATAGGPDTVTKAFQIAIGGGPVAITASSPVTPGMTSPLAGGTIGTTYSQNVGATGGVAPYTFSIAAGSLPPGLSLSAALPPAYRQPPSATGGAAAVSGLLPRFTAAAAVISGTPTAPGTFTFTVQVVDSVGTTSTQDFSITVAGGGVPTLSAWGMAVLFGCVLLLGTKALANRTV